MQSAAKAAIEEIYCQLIPLRQIRLMTEPFIGDDPELVAYWVLWMAYLTRAAHQPALREYTALRFRGWEQQMREIVTAGCASGDFHVNDETAAVRAIIALVDGLSLQHIFFRPDAVTTADRRRMRTAINAVLGIS